MDKVKKWAKIIGISLAVLLVLLVAAGIAMPGQRLVSATERIEATPLEIYPYLSDLRQWPNWTAWNTAADPSCKWEYSGPNAQQGATMTWKGAELGEGRVVLTRLQEGRSVVYDFTWGDNDPAEASFEMRVVGNATEIVWSSEIDLGWFPFSRLFGPFIQSMVEGDYEEGLERLKTKVEA